jgi:hypothetical protein
MFRKYQKKIHKKAKFKNIVFDSKFEGKRSEIDVNNYQFLEWNCDELETLPIPSKIQKFRNLNKILNKLLLKKSITQSSINALSKIEIKCLQIFLFKKRMTPCIDTVISAELFKKIYSSPKSKRVEEILKFIFKKLMQFLKNDFKDHVYPFVNQHLIPEYKDLEEKKKIEYSFFGFYFGEIADEFKKKIECFFLPGYVKNCIEKNKKFILKSVSQLYVNILKLSSEFVHNSKTYLTKILKKEMRKNIISKTEKICLKWEEMIEEMGSTNFVNWLETKYVKNPKCKQPWSIQQVELAIDFVMKLLA